MAPMYNWTGFYAGINGGYGWGSSNWDGFPAGNISTSGGVVGLTFGYNWQTPASPLVFGVETDIDWSNMRGSTACTTGCETRNNYLGTFRGRLGYAMDRWLPYITGGLAYGDIHVNQTGFARHQHHASRLDHRWRRRDRGVPAELDGEARVPLRRSRQHELRAAGTAWPADQCELPHQHGPRRPELPLLIRPASPQDETQPRPSRRALRFIYRHVVVNIRLVFPHHMYG